MNTRGIVQLVVLNIGVELGVLSPKLFSIFVLMATILTLLTSPILSLLYRDNYDIGRLSVPNIAADLRAVREAEINTEVTGDNTAPIRTISNGDISLDGGKRSSTKSSKRSSACMSARDTVVTFNERLNYTDIIPNTDEQVTIVTNRVDDTPARCLSMTRF